MSADMTGCAVESANHSDDLITVYHGAPEPMILCGYHESQGPRVFALLDTQAKGKA